METAARRAISSTSMTVDALVRASVKGGGLVVNVGSGVSTSIRDLWAMMAGPPHRIPSPCPAAPMTSLDSRCRPQASVHLAWAPWTELSLGLRSLG